MRVVICGGGIIGSSVAYHLAKQGVSSTVIERCHAACAASGKAGGFLAKDWCDTYELGPLSNISFEMHMSLSKEEDFKQCEYRRLDTLNISVREGGQKTSLQNLPEWVNGSVVKSSSMGSGRTTAQVLPQKLTNVFLQRAKDLVGTELRIGVVTGVVRDDTNAVTGVRVGEEVIPADVVVIALGPWSYQAMKWFDLAPIKGQRAHSIIVKPASPVSAHALFVEYEGKSRQQRSPEVYPRPDGTVYICGMSDHEQLPTDPADVKPNLDSCKILKDMAKQFSSNLQESEVLTEQACFLPISSDGLPLIGRIPNAKGAYIATGHSCWGILNAPATGEVMAQLIVSGQCTMLDIKPFDPARFM